MVSEKRRRMERRTPHPPHLKSLRGTRSIHLVSKTVAVFCSLRFQNVRKIVWFFSDCNRKIYCHDRKSPFLVYVSVILNLEKRWTYLGDRQHREALCGPDWATGKTWQTSKVTQLNLFRQDSVKQILSLHVNRTVKLSYSNTISLVLILYSVH